MKRLLSITVSLLAVILLNNYSVVAQITLTQVDFAVSGDAILNVNDTMPSAGILVGDTGSQTWDFSSLQKHSTDTTFYIDPSTTPYASDFPGANLAAAGDGFTGFISTTASEVNFVGFVGDFFPPPAAPLVVPFMPIQKVMEFPYTDGSSFQNTSRFRINFSGASVGAPIDSIGNAQTSIITNTVDAYGMVTTPKGTYNCIRSYVMETSIDSIFIKDPVITSGFWIFLDSALSGIPNPTFDTTYTYTWYANSIGGSVAEVETDAPKGTAISASYYLGKPLAAYFPTSGFISCKGDCDISATPTVANGATPYTYLWYDPATQTTATATDLCAGTTKVRIIDSNNDTAYANMIITEPLSPMSLIPSSVNPSCDTCMDATATVGVMGGDPPYTYMWNDPGSQTTQTATGLNPGNYMVTVTDGNGCVKSIADTVNVGIEEAMTQSINLKVFPNPTSGTLTISMDSDIDIVVVYGAKGELLRIEEIDGTSHIIDISDYHDGLYFLKLVSEDIQITKKVFLVR